MASVRPILCPTEETVEIVTQALISMEQPQRVDLVSLVVNTDLFPTPIVNYFNVLLTSQAVIIMIQFDQRPRGGISHARSDLALKGAIQNRAV